MDCCFIYSHVCKIPLHINLRVCGKKQTMVSHLDFKDFVTAALASSIETISAEPIVITLVKMNHSLIGIYERKTKVLKKQIKKPRSFPFNSVQPVACRHVLNMDFHYNSVFPQSLISLAAVKVKGREEMSIYLSPRRRNFSAVLIGPVVRDYAGKSNIPTTFTEDIFFFLQKAISFLESGKNVCIPVKSS